MLGAGIVASGLVAGLVLVRGRAIRESLASAEAIRESERQRRYLMNHTSSVIYIKDPDGRYQFINQTFEKLFGTSEEDVRGKTDFDLFPHDQAMAFQANDRKALAMDMPLEIEEEALQKDGIHTYISSKFPLKNASGQIYAVCGISTDITELKNLQDQLHRAQKMEAIGQLTGGLAHDLNNVLSIISINVGLLRRMLEDNPGAPKHVEATMKAIQRASDLTRKLLDFSRNHAGETKRVSVNEFIQGMENLIAKVLTPQIVLKTKLTENIWMIDIDTGNLEDAILNLALNAGDAMPEGGTLLIETANKVIDAGYVKRNPEGKVGEFVMVCVSDTGIGMSPQVAAHAFEPFFTTKDVGKGTGLGLSMVFGFVRRSGGHVKIYTEQGVGTEVRLYLPRAQGTAEGGLAEPVAHDHLPRGGETILVVDDEEALVEAAISILESLGYRTFRAANGAEALALIRADVSIDLMFSDVIMPGGIDGYHLAAEVWKTRPELKILLTSGFAFRRSSFATEESDAMKALSESLLHKPYNIAELAIAIRAALDSDNKPAPALL